MKKKTIYTLILAFVLFALAAMYFSYNLGKDAALRDNKMSKETKSVEP